MPKSLCIIPARGGSKRIPRKNIKEFLGKPIITYSIEAAIMSNMFDEVMVSTDDIEIAEIAKTAGATVPFMRSEEGSNDFASTSDVIREVITKYKEELDKEYSHVCCLYPIAPFVSPDILVTAFNELVKGGYNSLYPVVKFGYPIQRALRVVDGGRLEMLNKEYLFTRSQDLETRYHDVGQFYWLETAHFMEHAKILNENTGYVEVNELDVQDIDTITDWKIAELKYQLRSES